MCSIEFWWYFLEISYYFTFSHIGVLKHMSLIKNIAKGKSGLTKTKLFCLIETVESKLETKNKIIIATSASTTFGFALLLIALYVWRLMGRIKSLHFILGGKITFSFPLFIL